MNEEDIRLCIIGAGNLSTRCIYPNIGASGAELVGLADLEQVKRERNARRFGGTPYEDWEQMLDEQKPDGVIICIGPEQHPVYAQKVLRKGFPVYTEKPPATDAATALEVARTANETGLLCMTAFKKRYTRAANRARSWLAEFPEEEWLSLSADYCSAPYSHQSPRSSFLLDFAIHMIDLVPYLFGEVAEVFAFSRGLDAFAVSLRFSNGAVGSLNLNCGRSFSIPTEELELTIKGGNFMTIHNSSSWRISKDGQPTEWHEPPTFTSAGDSGLDTGHLAEIQDFVAALREGRQTRSAIYESYKSMVVYEAIAESAESGQVVDLVYEVV
jgi:UDP-N-acetylglucosamine 3-dehydrogenase